MNDVDLEGDGSGYSGTFRWKASKKLGSLPSSIKINRNILQYKSWMSYLTTRSPTFVQNIQKDLSYIDCLSSALSICYAFENSIDMKQCDSTLTYEKLTLVCIGCSSKAEERVLRETNCFLELCYYFFNVQLIDLWLVGPEMSATKEQFQTPNNVIKDQTMTYSTYKGTAIDFFRSYQSYMGNKHTVVVGFNCGFGNYENQTPSKYNLLLSWLPDLYFLTGTNLPVFFTCANDYADLHGEVSIMHKIMGANFILLPCENPFSYASTMVPPNCTDNSEYARGNSFCYGIQGSNRERRYKIEYTRGLQCIPQFLALFNTPASTALDQLLVKSRLDLTEVKSVEAPPTLEAVQPVCENSSANPVRETTATIEPTTTPAAAQIQVQQSQENHSQPQTQLQPQTQPDSNQVEEQPPVAPARQRTVEVGCAQLSLATVERQQAVPPKVVPAPVVSDTVQEATSNMSRNGDSTSGDSIAKQHNTAQTAAHQLATDSTLTSAPATATATATATSKVDFPCTQSVVQPISSISNSSHTPFVLKVEFHFGAAAVSMEQVDLHTSNDGTTLVLSIVNNSSGICDSDSAEVKPQSVKLLRVVRAETMGAKYSKKKNTLTVTADIR